MITLQLKIRVGDKSARRIIQVSEIDGIDEKMGQAKTHEIGNPRTDTHDYMGDSVSSKGYRKEMEIQKRKSIMS